MDRIINSKVDKQSIYEIYRACRLCGAGAGYKMPIIQNVIDISGEEVELKRKIRECVQIEVNQDDKMPPLICELCVDKVNDFYEFFEMCRQTNKRTRQRLGLPMQSQKEASDSGDCILGVTEPVYINEDSDEPLSRSSPRHTKSKSSVVKKLEPKAKKPEVKGKKPEVKVKVENHSRSVRSHGSSPRGQVSSPRRRGSSPRGRGSTPSGRGSSPRGRRSSPSPRATRQSRENDENISLSTFKPQTKRPSRLPPPTKSILKKEPKVEEKHSSRSKRLREPPKPEVPQKRVKLSVKPEVKLAARPERAKPERAKPLPPPPPPPTFRCSICRQQSKTSQANGNHMRAHTVTFTSPKLACDSCCSWFVNAEAAASHHRVHAARDRPYHCRGCGGSYHRRRDYDLHAETGCYPWQEIPDFKCPECWRLFPTNNLLVSHRCYGEDSRPGGKCSKCNRPYALLKNLKKHESLCTAKKRGELAVDPALLAQMRPLQIRFARCDELLTKHGGHYQVAGVDENYGLDPKCVYPYINSASLNCNRMVNIKSELDDFYCEEDYIHWDSDVSTDDDVTDKERQVYPLSTLSLKTLFSHKCLGRVPRKKRRIKAEKSVFDSLMNNEFDISDDIDNIIDNLDDDDDVDGKNDNDSVGRRQDIDAMINEDNDSEKKENVINNSNDDKNEANDLLSDDKNLSNEKDIVVKNEDKESKDSLHNDNIENNDDIKEPVSEEKLSENNAEITNEDKEEVNDSSESKSDETKLSKSVVDKEINKDDLKFNTNVGDKAEYVKPDTIQNNELGLSKDKDSASISLVESKDSCLNVCEITSQGVCTNDASKVNEIMEYIPRTSPVSERSDAMANDKDNLSNDKATNEGPVDDKVSINNDITKDNNGASRYINNEDHSSKVIDSETANKHQKDDINENNKENNDCISKTEIISKITCDIIENIEKDIIKNDESVNIHKTEVNTQVANSTEDSKDHHNNKETGSNNKSFNGELEDNSDKLNMDDFNDVCDAEIDDKKLMDDLDEHIGETDNGNNDISMESTNRSPNNEDYTITSDSKINDEAKSYGKTANDDKNVGKINNEDKSDSKMADDDKSHGKIDKNDKSHGKIADDIKFDGKVKDSATGDKIQDSKITLDDLIPKDKNSDSRSMDLDSISDEEFNYDS